MLGQGVRGPQEGFWRRAAAAVQPVAVLKTRVRFLFRRQAEEEYEEDMRRPADGGSSDGARCCRCAVPGASFLRVSGGRAWGKSWEKEVETRHPTHRRYRWWSGKGSTIAYFSHGASTTHGAPPIGSQMPCFNLSSTVRPMGAPSRIAGRHRAKNCQCPAALILSKTKCVPQSSDQ